MTARTLSPATIYFAATDTEVDGQFHVNQTIDVVTISTSTESWSFDLVRMLPGPGDTIAVVTSAGEIYASPRSPGG